MQKKSRLLLIGAESHHGLEVIRGVDAYCRAQGQWEFHLEANSSLEVAGRAQVVIDNWKPNGIIAFIRSRPMERVLRSSGLPIINFDAGQNWKLPTVISDSAAIGKMTARYFLDNGFKNFAFYTRNSNETNSIQRCHGFVQETRQKGFDARVFDTSYQSDPILWVQSYRQLKQWIESLKKPVGIMATYDSRAQELMMVCHRLGLRIPDDVAVVGVGNVDVICRMCAPPLSSLDPDIPRIGYEAARLMHCLLRGGKAPAKPILIPPRGIVTRQSSDMIALGDPDVAQALRLIRTHAKQRISVKEILQQIPVCRKTLESRFEKHVGRTPHEEIVRVRLEHAKDLIYTTAMPIKEIAMTMGFKSLENFSDFFRRHTAQTPTHYRHFNGGLLNRSLMRPPIGEQTR